MVEITVQDTAAEPATEERWQALFEAAGQDLVDPEVYKQYREFDRQHNVPPEL